MRKGTYLLRALLVVLTVVSGQVSFTQSRPSVDLFQQHISGFDLNEETVVDGIARLSQVTNISYSVEFPLGSAIGAPSPKLKTVTARVDPGTISDALDRLCSLDSTFTWQRIGSAAHVLPRSLAADPSYLLNRRFTTLNFDNSPDAEKAMFEAIAELNGPKEQLAVLQSGLSLSFARPLTATFHDITVREAFDKIAEQLGPTYGWQFGGAADFRVITFHARLGVKPKRPESEKSGK